MKASDFRKIINKLSDKFELKNDSTDHLSYEVWLNNIYITKVKNSYSSKNYIDTLIAQNLHISTTKLREYKACNFKNEDLIQKMKDKNRWPSGL